VGGLEVTVVADRFQPRRAELRRDVFGRHVEPARRRTAPFQRVGRQEREVAAHGVGGDGGKQLRLRRRQRRRGGLGGLGGNSLPGRLRGGCREHARQNGGLESPDRRHGVLPKSIRRV